MDKTFEELKPQLLELLEQGYTWHGKFTCKHCGARQTFEMPNLLYTQGICEECKQTSDLTRYGLMVIYEAKEVV